MAVLPHISFPSFHGSIVAHVHSLVDGPVFLRMVFLILRTAAPVTLPSARDLP